MLPSPTTLLALILAVLASLAGIGVGVYAYGAHQYSLGAGAEHARQEAATAVLNANLEAYEEQAGALEDQLARARAALVSKVGVDAANLPPRVGCDYPEPILSELNAITIRGRR